MKTFKTTIIAVIVVLLGALGGIGAYYWASRQVGSALVIQNVTKEEKYYIEENTALTQAIEGAESSVIGVKAAGKSGGSGLILTSDGLAVTMASVAPAGSSLSVYINGDDSASYQILKRDLDSDLALIKIGKSGLPTKGFADSSELKAGTRIFILSQIYSADSFFLSANEGIIKSFDGETIKTNINDSGAVSGSPAFDISGNFIGLAYKDSGNNISVIPFSEIRSFAGI